MPACIVAGLGRWRVYAKFKDSKICKMRVTRRNMQIDRFDERVPVLARLNKKIYGARR